MMFAYPCSLRPLRRLALLFLSSFCLPLLAADTVAPQSEPFLQASLHGIESFGASPLKLRSQDTAWLLPSALGVGLLLNNDVYLLKELSQGSARKDWLDQSMPTVSQVGEGWVEFSLATLGWAVGSERFSKTSAVAMQGLVVVAVYAEAFKLAAWSNRPSQDDQQHRFFAYDQSTMGMPSGHSFSAFCLAEIYGAEYGRPVPYALASVIAYSRIYNRAHWPSDVFVGSLLGVIAGVQTRHLAEENGAPRMRFSVIPREDTPLLTAEVPF